MNVFIMFSRRLLVAAVCILAATVSIYAQTRLIASAFAPGFGASVSGNARLTSVVGAPLLGESSNGTVRVFTGNGSVILQQGNVTSVTEEGSEIPKAFTLHQNFPNPFNPSTVIRIDIPKESWVVLQIYNMLGQRVRTLERSMRPAGTYTIQWNGLDDSGSPVTTGAYVYRLQAGEYVSTKRLMFLK